MPNGAGLVQLEPYLLIQQRAEAARPMQDTLDLRIQDYKSCKAPRT